MKAKIKHNGEIIDAEKVKFTEMKKDPVITSYEDLEKYIIETGMKRQRFAAIFGLKMPQLMSWKRIGKIAKRGYQVLLTIVKRHPELILELPEINADIEARERRIQK